MPSVARPVLPSASHTPRFRSAAAAAAAADECCANVSRRFSAPKGWVPREALDRPHRTPRSSTMSEIVVAREIASCYPSGENATCRIGRSGNAARRCGVPPAIGWIQIARPVRSTYARPCPSGVQCGTEPGSFSRAIGAPPSAFITICRRVGSIRVGARELRQPEVEDLHAPSVLAFADHDVARLQVAMEDPLPVRRSTALYLNSWTSPRIGWRGRAILPHLYQCQDRSHDRDRCIDGTPLRCRRPVAPRLAAA